MHKWGDDFDLKGLNDCEDILYNICRKYGRLGGQIKEKYGTLRFYAMFDLSLHSLVYPGYVYSQFPEWLWTLDIYYISPFLNKLFGKIWFWYQSKIYNYAYHKCLKKYPNLRDEILCCADYPELIKGNKNEIISS